MKIYISNYQCWFIIPSYLGIIFSQDTLSNWKEEGKIIKKKKSSFSAMNNGSQIWLPIRIIWELEKSMFPSPLKPIKSKSLQGWIPIILIFDKAPRWVFPANSPSDWKLLWETTGWNKTTRPVLIPMGQDCAVGKDMKGSRKDKGQKLH